MKQDVTDKKFKSWTCLRSSMDYTPWLLGQREIPLAEWVSKNGYYLGVWGFLHLVSRTCVTVGVDPWILLVCWHEDLLLKRM